jgi:iron complex outermembrane receptor protein
MFGVLPAFAQRALDEVIVTAQKKDDTLQTVPMTVNAVTSETIAKYNMLDFKDIQSVTPGLAIRAQDSRTYSVAMRGVNVLTDSGFGPSVAIYWNELTYDIDSAYKAMYDVGQIEILRGPQGTLRGVTSPSGAITLVTKAPSFNEIEGTVEQTFGERDLSNSQFGVSLPIIEDKLAMRIAGLYDHNKNDGIKNIVTGQENASQTRSGRMTLGLRATESLEAQLVYQYLEANNSGIGAVWGCGNGNVTRCLDKYDRRSVASTDSDTEQRRRDAALRVEWDLGAYTLISVTGYRDQHNYVDRNQDIGNVIPPTATLGGNTFPNLPSTQQVKTDRYDFTQEIRLSSNDADFYNWTYGLYGGRVRANTLVNQTQLLSAFFVPPAPIPPILLGEYLNIPLPSPIVVNSGAEEYSFFTNHSFAWTDEWESQIGLRYQSSRSTTELSGPSTFGPKSAVNEGVTGTASTSYQLTDDVRLYATYGHSYRSGGFTTAPQAPGELTQYEPEEADSIELGFKSRLADGRIQINGDIYFQKFHDFLARTQQAVRTVDTNGTKGDVFLGYNANAQVSGGELQIDALLTDDWQAGFSLAYSDAKFKDGSGPCNVYANGIVQDPPAGQLVNRCDVKGRLTGEPNWGASVTSEYTMHFGPIDTYIRGLYNFSTGRSDDSLPNSVLDTSSYGVFNLFIGVRDVKKTWEVSVWAKNLFDHQQVTRYSPQATVGSIPLDVTLFEPTSVPDGANPDLASGYSEVQLLPERQIGITGKYNFSL